MLENPDVIPFVPLIVSCMARPDTVPEAIKKLSANVWVRDVDGPTLAVVVPLLVRAVSDRSTTTQRQVVLLATNLFKMVRTPHLAAKHVPSILPGITRIAESASFPEIRDHARNAEQVLIAAATGGDPEGTPAEKRVVQDVALAQHSLISLVTKTTGEAPGTFVTTALAWIADAIAALVRKRIFDDKAWADVYVGPYLARFVPVCSSNQHHD